MPRGCRCMQEASRLPVLITAAQRAGAFPNGSELAAVLVCKSGAFTVFSIIRPPISARDLERGRFRSHSHSTQSRPSHGDFFHL
jgi:hypothetical protein